MNPIAVTIRQARGALNLTLQAAARRAGCSVSYLSMLETGRRELRDPGLAEALEAALGIERGRLRAMLEWEETPAEIRRRLEQAEEREARGRELASRLLSRPRSLDAMLASGELKRFVEASSGNVAVSAPLTRRVPVINRVAAGAAREFTDLGRPVQVADEYVTLPADDAAASDPQSFASRVVGDSMEPEYYEGDIVVFSPDAPTADGCDCFVRLERDQESTFKRVFFEGDEVRLVPLNPAYETRVVHREQIAGLFAAVSVMRPVNKPGPSRNHRRAL